MGIDRVEKRNRKGLEGSGSVGGTADGDGAREFEKRFAGERDVGKF